MDPHQTPPPADDLARVAAWRSRLAGQTVSVARGDDGVITFAPNRLVVNADDFAQLSDEAKLGLTFQALPDPDPPEGVDPTRLRGLDGAPRVGVVHLDGTEVALESAGLEAGETVSSREGAGTIAALLALRTQDVNAGLDVFGDWSTLPATASAEGGGTDVYQFPENRGRTQLVRAWQLIEAHRLLGGSPAPVQIGIIDRGFWFDPVSGACLAPTGTGAEFPGPVMQYNVLNDTARAGGPNPAGGPVTWHGQGTAALAVAPHGNAAGVAGAGGTVGVPFLFLHDISARMVIQAVRLATAWGVDVLNMSFGTTVTSFLGINPFPTSDYNAMFQWAEDNGVVIVAAAGNEGSQLPDLDVRPATRTPGVITVGALAAGDSDRAASFSNYGVSVDLWAPGDDVWIGPDGSSQMLGTTDGTSFASPIVAGAAAMVISLASDVWGRRPTAPEVQDVLARTAWRGSSDPRVTAGLDANAALWDVLGGQFRSDATEPNDTAQAARPLTRAADGRWVPSVLGPRALSKYGDNDWWLLDVPVLSRMQVRLDAPSYWGRPTLVLRPDDPLSMVPDEMTETAGTSSWTIDAPVVPPGRYRFGVIGGRTVYDLAVTLSAASLPADEWEVNNSLATASRFSMYEHLVVDPLGMTLTHPMGTYDFTLHDGDVDYLHVAGVPAAGSRTPEVQVGMADEVVTIEVLDRNGRVLRRTTGQYYAGRLKLEQGSCYVRVSAARPTRYKLTLTMMVDLTLPPLKIPIEELPPWEHSPPLWLAGAEKHYLITVTPGSPVVGLEASGSHELTLEVLDELGRPLVVGTPTTHGVRIDTSGLPEGEHVLRVARPQAPRRGPGVRFTVAPVLNGTYLG